MTEIADSLPFEDFIQALSSQLDRAQATLAVKARFGLPLTFAVKDLSIDLRAHVSVSESQVHITPVGPGDPSGSVIHLSFTTITRPMIQENTMEIELDDPPLHEVLGDEITEEEKRRLEWAGIRTVAQLRDMERQNGELVIEQVAQIPAMRLRATLHRASRPRLDQASQEEEGLRIRGRNLLREDRPQVRIDGRPIRILNAGEREIMVERPPVLSGTLSVETEPGMVAEAELADLTTKGNDPGKEAEA